MSRHEKDLYALEREGAILSEKERTVLATKEAKRASWAERMLEEHGEDWEAIVQMQDQNRTEFPIVPRKKKARWTQGQKDEHAIYRQVKRDKREAEKKAERKSMRKTPQNDTQQRSTF